MNYQVKSITELREWSKNPRSISKDGYARLKKQIETLKLFKPFLITPDGEVLGGNMRLKVVRELGITEVPVSVVEPKTEEEKLSYALADNDRAGVYDSDLLANLTGEFPEFNWADYSIDLKEPTNLQDLLDQFKEVVEDEVPEVPTDAVSKLGEVYQLGRHRLMCGDATKIEDVEKLMNGTKADMVFTDPPYGMGLNLDFSKIGNTTSTHYGVHKDYTSKGLIGDNQDYDPSFLLEYFKSTKEIFMWGADYYKDRIPDKGSWLVWDKKAGLEHEKEFSLSEFELCWSKQQHHRQIIRVRWWGSKGSEHKEEDLKNRVHPTQKPLQVATWVYKKYSDENNIIVDLYGGSGSFLIAAEQTNRICYMMELDPKYCDVIRKRYAKFIGKEAEWQTETPVIQ